MITYSKTLTELISNNLQSKITFLIKIIYIKTILLHLQTVVVCPSLSVFLSIYLCVFVCMCNVCPSLSVSLSLCICGCAGWLWWVAKFILIKISFILVKKTLENIIKKIIRFINQDFGNYEILLVSTKTLYNFRNTFSS